MRICGILIRRSCSKGVETREWRRWGTLVGTLRLVDRFLWTLKNERKAWVYMSATLSLQDLTSIRNDWTMGANPLSDAVATSIAR